MVSMLLLLLVSPPMLAGETLYGCYQSPSHCMYPEPEYLRMYYRDQYRHGCRTATVSGGPPLNLARQFDLMVEEKLVKPGQPVLCLSAGVDDYEQAKVIGKHVDRWPEIILANIDEVGVAQIKDVGAYSSKYWAAGYRTGTAIAGYNLYWPAADAVDGVLADWLDIWIVLSSTWQRNLRRRAFEQSAELWAYWAYPRELERDRFVAGLWCWKHNPKQFLFWAYTHTPATGILPTGEEVVGEGDQYSMVRPSVNGPVTTPYWEAVSEGIKDHALLDRLAAKGGSEAWLRRLADSIPEECPTAPSPVPRLDVPEIRQDVLRMLRD